MSSCPFTVCSSIRSRSSPRVGTGCWPTGWPTAERHPKSHWCACSRTRWPTRCALLRSEAQRDRRAEVHRATRRRALRDHRIAALPTVAGVGALVQETGPAERPQAWLGIRPEHAPNVGHSELIALRLLELDRGVERNLLSCSRIGAEDLTAWSGVVDGDRNDIGEARRSQDLPG